MHNALSFYFAVAWMNCRRPATVAALAAGLTVLVACSDNGDKSLTAPPAPRNATTSSGNLGHAAQITVCVDASSPAGTYKFRNSSWNSGLALPGYGVNLNGTWYDQGDGGEGYGAGAGTTNWSPAKGDNSEYTVAVSACVTVENRLAPSAHFASDESDDFQALNVTASTLPPGVIYDHTDCEGDVGVIAPQPTPCGTTANPTRAFANYYHGTQVTFVFKNVPPPPAECVLGYPDNSSNPRSSAVFNENEVLSAFGRGAGQIRAWYTDEHAMTLGVRQVFTDNKGAPDVTTNYTIALMTGNPSSATGSPVAYGSTLMSGEGAVVDATGRPLFPALFVTDLTVSGAASRAGDWQKGGTALAPNALYGTWKGAVMKVNKNVTPAVTTITPDADPAKNHNNVGAGGVNPPAGVQDLGYSTEVAWNIANIPGYDPTHTYRLQFMVHDGDQNKTGGDVGQACINIGPGSPTSFAKIAGT